MKCLVIIDMQPGFSAANRDWLINAIAEKAREYSRNGDKIVVVEYAEQDEGTNRLGVTFENIMTEVCSCKNWERIDKWQNDGSDELVGILGDERSCEIDEFEVVGVNLDACVVDTVMGMTYYYPNTPINILVDLTATVHDTIDHAINTCEQDLGYDECYGNVALIGDGL